MKPSVSKFVKKSLAWTLLVSLSCITAAFDSAAQSTTVNTAARMRLVKTLRGSPRNAPLVPASTPTWTLLFPTYSDPDLFFATALSEHSAVYDPGSNAMIVFGGLDQNNVPQNSVLVESNANGSAGLQAGVWSELNPAVVPPARIFHSAVYDQANNRMIVFGGCADLNCDIPLNDTWVLSNANGLGGVPVWTQLSPSSSLPTAREGHNAVYDAANNRLIVYSGAGAGFASLSDVWVLSHANGIGGTPTWSQLSPAGNTPDAVDGSTAVYDPGSNSMIVFGGGDFVNSVWTLSNANGMTGTPTWTNLIANGALGAPKPRIAAQAVYDPSTNRMTIFGGNGDFGYLTPDWDIGTYADTWVLTNANGSGGIPAWTQLHPKSPGDGPLLPGTRTWFSAVRDPGTNSMIIFGGISIEAAYGSPWVLSHANGL